MQELKDVRKMLNFSTQKMAEELGISTSLYEKVEYGQKNASKNFIKRFHKAFPLIDITIFFKE